MDSPRNAECACLSCPLCQQKQGCETAGSKATPLMMPQTSPIFSVEPACAYSGYTREDFDHMVGG